MRLVILGFGKFGKEIEDVAIQMGCYSEIVFLDDKINSKLSDWPTFVDDETVFFVAFGDNNMRQKWIEDIKASNARLTNIIHPTAYISPMAQIGVAVAVLPKAVVNTYCVIEDGAIINTGSIVDHDTTIGKYSHICVGAIVKADNMVPSKERIEAGVVIERFTFQ